MASEELDAPVTYSADSGCKEPFCLWLTGAGVIM